MATYINKKAQNPGDLIMVAIFIFFIAIGGVIAAYTFGEVFTKLKAVPMFNATATQDVLTAGENVGTLWDYLILILFIGFTIGLLVLAYFIDVQSIFMPFFIIFIIIGVLLAWVFGYVWDVFFAQTAFSTVTTDFPITDHILTNFGLYFTIMAVLSFIVTYAKSGEQ